MKIKHLLIFLGLTPLLVFCGGGDSATTDDDATDDAADDAADDTADDAADDVADDAADDAADDSADDEAPADPIIRLFYFQTDMAGGDPAADPNPHNIYSAVSSDGVNFTQEEGTRFSRLQITDPDVFEVSENEFVMFTSAGQQLIRATATEMDGTFTEETEFQWNAGGVSSTVWIGPEGEQQLYTFFCTDEGINVARHTESGSVTFEREALLRTASFEIICDPTIVFLPDGSYLMFYKAAEEAASGPAAHQVYVATSSDGLTYTDTGRLIRDQASVPGAVAIEGTIYLYFVDGSGALGATSGLGVGISTDEGSTFSFEGVTIEGTNATGAADPNPVVLIDE